MIPPEELKAMRARNIGCHQCEEGRPHSHRPDFTPYVLNPTVERLIAECERLQGMIAEASALCEEHMPNSGWMYLDTINKIHHILSESLKCPQSKS